MNVLERFKPITTFVFDVDGVLTDGTLFLFPGGEMVRRMNIKDGYALQLAIKQGYHVVIISGGHSDLVRERLERLGVTDIFMKVNDKKAVLNEWLLQHDVRHDKVLFMGDDVPDLDLMMQPGILPACPSDAATEILQVSTYISPLPGGMGCVRDVIEKVMRVQDKWHHLEHVVSK